MATATEKTYMAKSTEVKQKWYLIDAKDQVLGKIATKAASYLRGKHKATFTPHVDTGDFIIVINAAKLRVTGNKLKDKEYQRYSGFHSGQYFVKLEKMLKDSPETVIRLAVDRMVPSGALGNKVMTKLKIFAGEEHPHQAQQPVTLTV